MKKFKKIITALCVCVTALSAVQTSAVYAAEPTVLSEDTLNFYNQWKDKYLVKNPYSANEEQYYVWYSGERFEDNKTTTAVTVSEAHGYGMLIAASLAEYDSDAKDIFDGMYRYYSAHLSGIGPHLMAWHQSDNGTAIIDTEGNDSASDGDMDIAYALLMADSVWGSSGEINYKQSALNVINDIMEYEVNKTDWIIQFGDWLYGEENSNYYSATRSSDFIMQYMPVFAEATGDSRWMNVYESTYGIINDFTANYNTGLLPDFIVKDKNSGKFVPANPDFLEGEYDGCYSYNSCRTPWRIAMDCLINKNENALSFAKAINAFAVKASGSDPWEIMAGYKLDGTPTVDYNDLCFTAPFLVSAKCEEAQQWHDAVRDTVINYGDDVYYGDTIKLLCLIADDGGWIIPDTNEDALLGDVNSDGIFNSADVVAMQKWLIFSEEPANSEVGDMNADNIINVFDICLMRKKLCQNLSDAANPV